MNDRYFYCDDCKEYLNAGYRHAYHALEKGEAGLTLGNLITVETVLDSCEYWHAPYLTEKGSEWLRELLPEVRQFLEEHRDHGLHYSKPYTFLNQENTEGQGHKSA